MNHESRIKSLQQSLASHRLHYFLVTHGANVRYLCGFTGSAGALLVSLRKAIFFTDGRYIAQAKDEVCGARVVIAKKPPLAAAADFLKKVRGVGTIGIEGDNLTVAGRTLLLSLLPKGFRLRSAPSLVEQQRLLKDRDEVELLRSAVLLGSTLFDVALKAIRPGVREIEVAAEMEYAARRAGADAMSFETIIASGTRSALPHGRASQSRIPDGGFVVCDFGVILTGYCSDMTRTVYVGSPSEEACRFYNAVKRAQQDAVESVRPGIRLSEVDAAARKVLQNEGLERYFTHSTGHGVGIEIHEAPRVAAGQRDLLQPGMVITIEPGAYIPGRWGVRIEDMVVVTETGCEVLTPTTKELISI